MKETDENRIDSFNHSDLDKNEVVANILKGYEDFTLDSSGKIISSNLEAVNVTGYEEWEVMGRNFSLFYSDIDRQTGQPQKDLEKTLSDGRITFSAWRLKKRSATFWAQITLSCLNNDGFQKGFKMILKDQTHRLISNNRVKRFRGEYLNLFNNPFIGIFKFRMSDYKLVLTNDKAGKMFAKGKDYRNFDELFKSGDDFKIFLDALNKEERVNGFEFQLKSEAKLSWARIDCRLFPAEGFVEGIITDISENKEQLLELRNVNEELDRFIYHASHDLRSPLTTLMGLINLVEFDNQIELKEYCRMMRERVSYLDELLRDLAAITYNSKSEIAIQTIDFPEIIQNQISESKLDLDQVNITFDVSGEIELFSDKNRVQVILKKLISNAIKHHNPHFQSLIIQIRIELSDRKAIIKFKDNGRGIKDDQLLQIFGMFYKSSNEVIETGLGLYIAKLMIDKIQGKIRVTSRVGVGTEFEIELPDLRSTTPRGNNNNPRNGHKKVNGFQREKLVVKP